MLCCFLSNHYAVHRDLHSFPTRRSSDLGAPDPVALHGGDALRPVEAIEPFQQTVRVVRDAERPLGDLALLDRKSTRLNSSHVEISYAVFCLKKKNKIFSYQI